MIISLADRLCKYKYNNIMIKNINMNDMLIKYVKICMYVLESYVKEPFSVLDG